MASRERYTPYSMTGTSFVPFDSAEQAWFWFVQAQQARIEGARFTAGQTTTPRPCEPIDILRVLDRLYRTRRLLRDHLLVLRHYGRRAYAPDPRRVKEMRAHKLWVEALNRIETVLERKGIVRKSSSTPHQNWQAEAFIFEGGAA